METLNLLKLISAVHPKLSSLTAYHCILHKTWTFSTLAVSHATGILKTGANKMSS